MSEFGNCKMQRKLDGKIIFAKKVGEDTFCPQRACMLLTAEYYSDDGVLLNRKQWREIEHKDDYAYESALVPIDDGIWERIGYMSGCAILLFSFAKYLGAI